jgi:hypothetical protein
MTDKLLVQVLETGKDGRDYMNTSPFFKSFTFNPKLYNVKLSGISISWFTPCETASVLAVISVKYM